MYPFSAISISTTDGGVKQYLFAILPFLHLCHVAFLVYPLPCDGVRLIFWLISTATDPQIEHKVEHENITPSEAPAQLRSSKCSVSSLTHDGKATEDLSHELQINESEPDQGRAVLPGGSPQTISANCHVPPDRGGE